VDEQKEYIKPEQVVRLLAKHAGDIPLWLLAGHVAVESGFNARSHSSLGELGLMEIHPDTLRDFGLNPENAVVREMMFNPETNVRYGVMMYQRIINRIAQHYQLESPEALWRAAYLWFAIGGHAFRKLYPEGSSLPANIGVAWLDEHKPGSAVWKAARNLFRVELSGASLAASIH